MIACACNLRYEIQVQYVTLLTDYDVVCACNEKSSPDACCEEENRTSS